MNYSNRNVPTRKVEFQNVTMELTKRFQDDPSVVKTQRLRFSADLDQKLDHAFLKFLQKTLFFVTYYFNFFDLDKCKNSYYGNISNSIN